jgi:hypothetical protein
VQIKPGSDTAVEFSSDAGGSGLAIYLSDPGTLELTWRLEVYAYTARGRTFVGQITTRTPPAAVGSNYPRSRSRLVAIANCPGVKNWSVVARYASPAPYPDAVAELELTSSETTSGPFGIVPQSERYHYLAGTGNGSQAFVGGQRIQSWAAFATGAGATVTIAGAGGTTIPISTAGNVRGDPGGTLEGATFTFAGGVTGWFIEWKEN